MDAWRPWHPAQVAERLTGVRTPWYVAGGWAIDLHLGGTLRDHEDLEIAVPEAAFAEIAGPDVALLFKAKHRRPKDDEDYAVVLPRLTADERAWLGRALRLVHPGHAWLADLS